MRARFTVGSLSCLLLAGACGGRSVQTASGEGAGGALVEGGSASTGAAPHGGGRAPTAGSAASGGRTGAAGASFTGGSSSAGASSVGGACACAKDDCMPGFMAVPDPDGCCAHCESCNAVSCPAIACASGSHLELPAGQCCPICLQDSCEAQQTDYQITRRDLIQKYSALGCMTNEDCAVYYESNPCSSSCGTIVPRVGLTNLHSNLQSYAESHCSPKCTHPVPPCPAPPLPSCVGGLCQ